MFLCLAHAALLPVKVEQVTEQKHSIMQPFIKLPCGRTIRLETQSGDTIETVKMMVELKENIPRGLQYITFTVKPLSDSVPLVDYRIKEGSRPKTLHKGAVFGLL